MKNLKEYQIKEINRINDCNLLIHWWNGGKKTLDFKGTVKEYLRANKIPIKLQNVVNGNSEMLVVKVKNNIGRININFTINDYEQAVKQIIFQRLSYLGDKAKFSFNGREYSNNFHR